MTKEKSDLDFLVTEDRIKLMPLLTFYQAENKSITGMVEFCSHFLVDGDGEYMSLQDANMVVMQGRNFGDLEQLMQELIEAMEGAAVPKE